MLWQHNEKRIAADYLGPLLPERVLFEFDGPRTFTARDSLSDLLLLHQCAESSTAWRYFVVPFSESLLMELEEGRLDLRTALDQPRLWIADLDASGVAGLFRVQDKATVEEYLPVPGTMLFPEQEPLLELRSVGRDVQLGKASLGIIQSTVANVRAALKELADCALGTGRRPGHPSSFARHYYDLPASVTSGSLRISVLPESTGQQKLFDVDDVWQRMETLLHRGLAEAFKDQTTGVAPDVMDAELRVALRAVYLLTPPANTAVDTTEISGRLVEFGERSEPIVLTKTTRASLRHRLQQEPEPQLEDLVAEGFITALDLAEFTCLLRDQDENTIADLTFEEQFLEDVKEAFDSGRPVKVIAQRVPGIQSAVLLVLRFVSTEPSAQQA